VGLSIRRPLVVCLVLGVVVLELAGQPLAAEDISEPLFAGLLATYQQYRAACQEGDLEAFRAVLDDDQLAEREAILAQRGLTWSPELIQSSGYTLPEIPAREEIVIVKSGSWVQFRFSGGEAPPDVMGPRRLFHAVLFRKRAERWKIVGFAYVQTPTHDESGVEVSVETFDIPEKLRIPEEASQ